MESVEMDGIDMSVIVLLLATSAVLVKEVSYCFSNINFISIVIYTSKVFAVVT